MPDKSDTQPFEEPFAAALREAIEASGLGLDRLQYRLAQGGTVVSSATLSYWQSGRRRPERPSSLRAVTRLEVILGLSDGALRDLVGPPRPRGRWLSGHAPISLDAWWPDQTAVSGALGRVDTRWDDALERISHHDRIRVDADGGEQGVRVRQILRATRDGADRWVLLYHLDDHGHALPQIRALRGCRLGVVHADPGIGMLAAELLFPRPLAHGETVVTEHEILNARPRPRDGNYERKLRMRVREYVVEVDFDPAAPPRHCEQYVVRDLPGQPEHAVHLTPDRDGRVHAVALNVDPCRFGLRWQW